MNSPRTTPDRLLTFMLAALTTLGPFSVSTYLPSFPAIAQALGATPLQVQQTLSVYLAAFAFMTLWHGPVSDALGRRRVILAGLVLYTIASFGCALATRIEHLWLMRALQGLSAGAGAVVARAVARDLYDGATAQKVLANMGMLFALAPAAAPFIGGWLHVVLGWRSVFVFLGLASAALGLLIHLRLPESLPAARRQTLAYRGLARGYGAVLAHGRFLAFSVAYASMFGSFFLYVSSAPVFLTRHLGLGPTDFLWLFGPAMLGMMAGSWVAGRTADHWTRQRTLVRSFATMALAFAFNLAVNLWASPAVGWTVLHIAMLAFGMTLAAPTITVLILDCFPERRGLASAAQTCVHTAGNALIAAVLAPWLWDTPWVLSLGSGALTALGAGSLALASWLARRDAVG